MLLTAKSLARHFVLTFIHENVGNSFFSVNEVFSHRDFSMSKFFVFHLAKSQKRFLFFQGLSFYGRKKNNENYYPLWQSINQLRKRKVICPKDLDIFSQSVSQSVQTSSKDVHDENKSPESLCWCCWKLYPCCSKYSCCWAFVFIWNSSFCFKPIDIKLGKN